MLDERLIGTNCIEAVLDNGIVYHFRYNGELDKLEFIEKNELLSCMTLRANPRLDYPDGTSKNFKTRRREPLILEYHIDPELVPTLISNNLIRYSAFAALLYELPKEQAWDYNYHKNNFKRSHTKEKVLTNAKMGIFN